MSAVFISYRRDDSAGHTGRLYDHLREEFGKEYVFRDIDTIEPGTDFVEAVEDGIKDCSALIVVIGNEWLSAADEMGRRLHDPNDFVRLEIASALKKKLRIIPVLVQGAKMPPASELPEDIAALARRHALEISDSRWDYDMGRLITTLSALILKTSNDLEASVEANEDIQSTQETSDPDATLTVQQDEAESETTHTGKATSRRPVLVMTAIGSAIFLAIMAWQYFPEKRDTGLSTDKPATSDSTTIPDTIPTIKDTATTDHAPPQLQEQPDREKQSLLTENALRIKQLLIDAENDKSALRLTSPAGNNAFEKYNEILQIEPDHPDAQTGIRSIAEKYIGLAESALRSGNFTKAGNYLEQARSVYPQVDGISALQARITEEKQQIMTRQQEERNAEMEQKARMERELMERERIDRERLEREIETKRQAALAQERIQSCLTQCEDVYTNCKDRPLIGKNECEARVEAECEKVHQACLGDPQVSMTWGDIGAESECLGRWSQCTKREIQQCQEAESKHSENCETAFSACRSACR